MFDIYVIGCGGIGGYLLQLLPQCLASLMLDVVDNSIPSTTIRNSVWSNLLGDSPSISSYLLQNAQNLELPTIANSLTLIDADTFDPHNAVRQASGAGSKLAVQMTLLQQSVLFQVWLKGTKLQGVDAYVKPTNITKIIPQSLVCRNREPMADNDTCGLYCTLQNAIEKKLADLFQLYPHIQQRRSSIPVVFLCVDNHKTRYEVCRYMEQFDNCVVINGGNSKTAGNANIYVKRGGVALDIPIYELYPEIKDPESKRPDEVGCTEVSLHNDQISIVNSIIAAYMVLLFRKFVLGELTSVRGGKEKRLNEVLIDCDTCSTIPRFHNVN